MTRRQIMLVFCGTVLGMMLAALDQTIVATALAAIVADLHGFAHLSWVVTAYLLTSTITVPLSGGARVLPHSRGSQPLLQCCKVA